MNVKPNMAKHANENTELVKKYLGRALIAGGLAAAITEIAKKKPKSVKDESTNDLVSGGNTIVVPVKKEKFMEGLPTPEELSASRGEDGLAAQMAQSVSAAPAILGQMSDEEIEARKKEILRGNARRIDFFSKAAEKSEVRDVLEKGTDKKTSGKEDSKEGEGEKSDKKKVDLPRDEEGKFVSQTSPVGVLAEKEAGSDLLDYIWKVSKEPTAIGVGLIGSVYIASKLATMINKRRRENSEYDLEKAREEYVGNIQGESEKTAGDKLGPVDRGLQIGAGAFIIPLALTAMVTNKIIENRKAEKKREKEMSDSYPEEPTILYKTSEDQTFEISPRTAVAMIAVKRAMIEAYEWPGSVKSAALTFTPTEAVNELYGAMKDPKNNEHILNAAKEFYGGNVDAATEHFKKMEGPGWLWHRKAFSNPEVMRSLMNDKRVHNLIGSRMADKKYADTWGKFSDDVFSDQLAKKWGLTSGSWLHTLLAWLGNFTGIGRNMVREGMVDRMKGAFQDPQQAQAAQQAQSAQQVQASQQAQAARQVQQKPEMKQPAASTPKTAGAKPNKVWDEKTMGWIDPAGQNGTGNQQAKVIGPANNTPHTAGQKPMKVWDDNVMGWVDPPVVAGTKK